MNDQARMSNDEGMKTDEGKRSSHESFLIWALLLIRHSPAAPKLGEGGSFTTCPPWRIRHS